MSGNTQNPCAGCDVPVGGVYQISEPSRPKPSMSMHVSVEDYQRALAEWQAEKKQPETLQELIGRFRSLPVDHKPDGWPAVQTKEITALLDHIAALKAQLVTEAARTAQEKLRANQMTEQHSMQAKMHAQALAQLAAVQQGVQRIQANCYSDNDGDSWRDCPDDCDFVEGLKVGETFELQASVRSWSETFRVTKAPDDESDDYEVELVSSDAPIATHPTQQGLAADGMYYLQDARWSAMVGNCPSFWREGGNGYTTNIDEAGRFTFDDAMAQHRCRETDLPWLCAEVDKLRRPTVDCQYMPRNWDEQRAALAAQAKQGGV